MRQALILFASTFSALFTVINPREAMPIFLKLLTPTGTVSLGSSSPLWA